MKARKEGTKELPPTDNVWTIRPRINAPRGETVTRFRSALDSILVDSFPVNGSTVDTSMIPHPQGRFYTNNLPENVHGGCVGVPIKYGEPADGVPGDKICFLIEADESQGVLEVDLWTHVVREPEDDDQREKWNTIEQRREDAEKFARELIRKLQQEWAMRSDAPAWTELQGKSIDDAMEYVYENGPSMTDIDGLTWPHVADLLDDTCDANTLSTEFYRRKKNGDL